MRFAFRLGWNPIVSKTVSPVPPMTDNQQARWTGSRYGFAVFFFLSLIAGWTALRVVLFLAFKPAGLPRPEVVAAFLDGFHRDCFASLLLTAPLLVWMLIVPEPRFVTRWRIAQLTGRRRSGAPKRGG